MHPGFSEIDPVINISLRAYIGFTDLRISNFEYVSGNECQVIYS